MSSTYFPVSKIFGRPYKEAGMDRIGQFHDGGFNNEPHFNRYDMNDIRFHDRNGPPVAPVYKYRGYFDNGVGALPRGKDVRNVVPCERTRQQQQKENVPLIMDRPLQ